MRSSKGFIIIIALLVFISGCSEDFTLLAPKSQRNMRTFYETEQDMRLAVNAVYDALQLPGTYGYNYYMTMEMRSDNTDQGPDVTGLAASLDAIDKFEEQPTSGQIETVWIDSYKGVSRANVVISRIDGVDIDQSLKDQLKGEALFLRSLFYYNIPMTFGNVPLVLEETSSPYQEINQVSRDEVLNQIASDLADAEDLLPATAADAGRATKGAAATLLGKVHLALGNNSEAETALRRVVGNYQLVDDYANLWGPENDNNVESIFEVQFKMGGLGEGSGFTNIFSPSSNLQTGEGIAENRPTEDIWEAYEAGDLRRQISMDTMYVTPAGDTGEARWVKKFHSDPFSTLDAENNFIVLRYADVLLMLAEATGESPEAYDLINQVRSRAGLGDIDGSTPGTFEEKLLHERRVELAFEYHRWFDLVRFGKAQEVMAAHLGKSEAQINLLFPIPQREIDVAPDVMGQNPGY